MIHDGGNALKNIYVATNENDAGYLDELRTGLASLGFTKVAFESDVIAQAVPQACADDNFFLYMVSATVCSTNGDPDHLVLPRSTMGDQGDPMLPYFLEYHPRTLHREKIDCYP